MTKESSVFTCIACYPEMRASGDSESNLRSEKGQIRRPRNTDHLVNVKAQGEPFHLITKRHCIGTFVNLSIFSAR